MEKERNFFLFSLPSPLWARLAFFLPRGRTPSPLPFVGWPSSARRPLPRPFPLPTADSLGPAVSAAFHLQPFHVACRQGGTAAPLRVVGASFASSASTKEGQTPSCPPLQFSSSLETVAPNHSNREDRELASRHCSSFIISGSSPPRLKSW